jgi:hypothetical protein
MIFFSSLNLCNISSFSHDRSDLHNPVSHSKVFIYFRSTFRTVQFSAPYKAMLQMSKCSTWVNFTLNLSRICWWKEPCWMLQLRRQSGLWGDYWTEIVQATGYSTAHYWKRQAFRVVSEWSVYRWVVLELILSEWVIATCQSPRKSCACVSIAFLAGIFSSAAISTMACKRSGHSVTKRLLTAGPQYGFCCSSCDLLSWSSGTAAY